MLDENFPTFFIKTSPSGTKHDQAVYHSQYGFEPKPVYALRHFEPSSQAGKNCYAVGLVDSFSPDILFGEVLVQPQWTRPLLSQDEPPQPVVPTQFIIQLYNPDSHITVAQKPGSWGASPSYGFALPQSTFRTPSSSTLDRSQSDPAVAATTPHLTFVWRKESKLSKDVTCYFTGKSTAQGNKKKNKEPDIPVALFRSLREITIYEPNLYRLELEDTKGFELVLLLGAVVIRDVYFGQIKNVFNIADHPRKASTDVSDRKHPSVKTSPDTGAALTNGPLRTSALPQRPARASPHSILSTNQLQNHNAPSAIVTGPPLPPVDPRTQWEIDAETARLQAEVEAEERQRRRVDEARRKKQQKAEDAEWKRLKQMVEVEEEDQRRRQAEVDKETERLRRLYGRQELPMPLARSNRPSSQGGYNAVRAQPQSLSGPYLQAPVGRYVGASTTFSGSATELGFEQARKLKAGKKSIWGLRSHSEASGRKLTRKTSSMF